MIPFRFVPDARDLADLRARLRHARWPERETVNDWSQGVPLAFLQDLCAYWADGYDAESRIAAWNRPPHFTTTIDGLPIHFVHLPSPRADAVPLVLTHGWPGSFLEYAPLADALAEPPAGDIAFSVVVPSLPGYGFSGKPDAAGWSASHVADAWAELMSRLGYDRFGAAGSDWGTTVSTMLGERHSGRVVGIHLMPPLAAFGAPSTDAERRAIADFDRVRAHGSAYGELHRTRPQTIGYGLVDSPVLLAAWIVEKFHEWTDGGLWSAIDRDTVLDDVTLYWLTRSGASAPRLYRESAAELAAALTDADPAPITVPVGATIFPAENPRISRRWAKRRFPHIEYWGEPDRGGHFAALEEPDLVVAELRASFAAMR